MAYGRSSIVPILAICRQTVCRATSISGLSLKHFFSGSKAFKSSLLVLLALMGLAPVLRTLTAATSSDSIWALSACLFLLNTLLADYSCMRSGSFTQERSVVSSFVKLINPHSQQANVRLIHERGNVVVRCSCLTFA